MSKKHKQSDSESEGTRENSSSEEDHEETDNGSENIKVPEYEKQRQRRIEENKARMEALGLRKMASKIMGSVSVKKQSKSKGKEKGVEEDEEYRPYEGDELMSSESKEDGDGDDEDFVGVKGSGSRARKKVKNIAKSKSKRKVPCQKLSSTLDFIDEDDALKQAIALSLQDSRVSDTVHNGPSQSDSGAQTTDTISSERKGSAHVQKDSGRRKKKKSIPSRVQMTEDELIIHFFQFDEADKGGINFRDLQRVANAHDFPWTDEEITDMIRCFDSNGDGKLNLEDFRAIVSRCNMIKGPDNASLISKP